MPSRVVQWWHALALAGIAQRLAGLSGGVVDSRSRRSLEDLPRVVVAHHVASLTPSGPRI
jgi:hypothetical protein